MSTVHGLGPHATVVEEGDNAAFMPVAVLVGGIVYVEQAGHLIVMTHETAGKVAALIAEGVA